MWRDTVALLVIVLIGSVVTIYRSDRTRRAVDAEQTYNRPYEET